MQFEVQIPKRSNPGHVDTLFIEGPNWLFALRSGLQQLGDSMETRNMICDILGENIVQVQESNGGRTFSIKPLTATSTLTPANEPAPEVGIQEEQPVEIHAAPQGATEAFLPPIQFFDNVSIATTPHPPASTLEDLEQTPSPIVEGPAWNPGHTMQTPQEEPIAYPEETQGQPVSVQISTPLQMTSTVEDINEDMPFPLANIASSERLPEEDLDFLSPIPIDTAQPAPAIEQLAIVEEPPVVPSKPVAKPVPPETKALPELTPIKPIKPEKPEPPHRSTPPTAPHAANTGLSISSIASGGKYSPGMTTEILADAFMRAMEIYDYGEDRRAAMQFVLDLAINNVNASGGAVLLTDINSPNQELWFEVATGPKADELLNFRIPMGQGIIGFCAQEGVSKLIVDPTQEPRYHDDVLHLVKLSPSSILVVPIQHQKRMLGVVVMYAQQGDRPFTQGELSILNYLAHTAGEYLINLV